MTNIKKNVIDSCFFFVYFAWVPSIGVSAPPLGLALPSILRQSTGGKRYQEQEVHERQMGTFWDNLERRVANRRGDVRTYDTDAITHSLSSILLRTGATAATAPLDDTGQTQPVWPSLSALADVDDDMDLERNNTEHTTPAAPIEPAADDVIARGEEAAALLRTAAGLDKTPTLESLRLQRRALTFTGAKSDVRWTYGDHNKYRLELRDYLEAGVRVSDLYQARVLTTYEDLRDRFYFVPTDLAMGRAHISVASLRSIGIGVTWERLRDDFDVTPAIYLSSLRLAPLEMLSLGATADVILAPDDDTYDELWGPETPRPSVKKLGHYVSLYGLTDTVDLLGVSYQHLAALQGRRSASDLHRAVSKRYKTPMDMLKRMGYTRNIHATENLFEVPQWDDVGHSRAAHRHKSHHRRGMHARRSDSGVSIIEEDDDEGDA